MGILLGKGYLTGSETGTILAFSKVREIQGVVRKAHYGPPQGTAEMPGAMKQSTACFILRDIWESARW